jgi:hypothetical protein
LQGIPGRFVKLRTFKEKLGDRERKTRLFYFFGLFLRIRRRGERRKMFSKSEWAFYLCEEPRMAVAKAA